MVGSRGGDLEKDLEVLGVETIRIPLTTKCEISPKVFMSFLKLNKRLKGAKVDIIHANTRVTQVLAELLSRSAGAPYISTCHGYFKTRLGRRLLPCWGKKVVAISDQVREHLITDFHLDPDRIALIYNGVDLEKFRPREKNEVMAEKKRLGLDPEKRIIGHIGRLSSVKGQRFLILAAEKLIRERGDLQLLIIGDGGEERDLKKLIDEKGLSSSCFIRPSVQDTSVALGVMDIFVMPSLQEGLGISILEAQAAGVPVAASRVGGIPTIVQDGVTGLLFEAGNADSLASAVSRLLKDPGLKNCLVQDARRQVREKFALTTMADKTRALYASVLLCLKEI